MVTARFEGFRPEAIQFMADLASNNDRAWFAPRKAEYERLVKAPLEALCVALGERFSARGIPLTADPKRSPFRIYRDTRFSRDKSPFKTHIAASFPWAGEGSDQGAGEEHHGGGGYFNFEPGSMYVGGGMWMPERERLEAFRRIVRDEPDRVRAAIEEPRFVAVFGGVAHHDALKRIPSGYPADHPLADLFRWKDLVFGHPLADAEVGSPDLPDRLADDFEAAVPVLRFIASIA